MDHGSDDVVGAAPASGREAATLPVTQRTQVNRKPDRQVVQADVLDRILDGALIAHVAVLHDDVPVVLPFACARYGDALLLHGSTGAGVLRACASGLPMSTAVTHVDGLVVARSAFNNSMNYRSAVIIGVPEELTGDDKERALVRLTDHLLPGRFSEVRANTRKETVATLVVRLRLDEVSVKVRSGPAITEPDDQEDPAVWAGVVPLALTAMAPVPDANVTADVAVPASVRAAIARHSGRS